MLFETPALFMAQLVKETRAFLRLCERKGLKPAIRPNGTSDLDWTRLSHNGLTMFETFPGVQFYDYTKIANRFRKTLPTNYHLCQSWSGANAKFRAMAEHAHQVHGASLIIVVRNEQFKSELLTADPSAVDGDVHDLRFLDAPGSVVYLKAKGQARHDHSGFVLDSTWIKS